MSEKDDATEISEKRDDSAPDVSDLTRRGVLALAGVAGLGLTGTASADDQTTGSGNADTVDGHHANEFLHVDGSEPATGDLTLDSGAGALKLREGGVDHTYMELYADSDNPSSRSAWMGYGSSGSSEFTINNEMGGDISLTTASGASVNVYDGEFNHDPGSYPIPSVAQAAPIDAMATHDYNSALNLHIPTTDVPENYNPEQYDIGYASKINWWSKNGDLVASLSGDNHNHVGFYTNAQPINDGTASTNMEKRLNIQGGASEVNIEAYTLDHLLLHGSSPTVRAMAGAGNDGGFAVEEDSALKAVFKWDASRNSVRIQNYGNTGPDVDMLELHGDSGEVRLNGNDLAEAANITADETISVSGEAPVEFGDGNYTVRYDSGADTLKFETAENGPVAELDSAGNMTIEGTLTENGSVGE